MRLVEKRPQVSRRHFLKATSATMFGSIAVSGGGMLLLDPKGAWAITLTTLKPATMATLIQMARDTYPHDRLTDAVYAKSVASYDVQAGTDPAVKKMIEDGTADLDQRAQAAHQTNYVNLGWEEQRTEILRQIDGSVFFQTIRADMVTSLYNQHDIWMKFGYEGASADKGGYLHRGFNDIDWLNSTQGSKS